MTKPLANPKGNPRRDPEQQRKNSAKSPWRKGPACPGHRALASHNAYRKYGERNG
jgi:hypothetical protein